VGFEELSFHKLEALFVKWFGDPFAKMTAQQKLNSLQQGSCSALAYSMEFQELALEAEFNDSTMISGLYNDLNEEVKDAIAFIANRPEKYDEYTQMIILVNNRLFEQWRETVRNSVSQLQDICILNQLRRPLHLNPNLL
jgi:hypothetical protein